MDNKKMRYMGVATIFVVFVLAMFTADVGAEEELLPNGEVMVRAMVSSISLVA
jgi:hypothetical protein